MKQKCCKRIGVRQYKKSSIPRLRWTPQLHELFIEAVQLLGGGHSKCINSKRNCILFFVYFLIYI